MSVRLVFCLGMFGEVGMLKVSVFELVFIRKLLLWLW